MTRIITFILALVTAICVNAQNYTYNFSSTPLSEALLLISREHPELSIHFIYNELEDYTTSARVSTIDPYEAVRRTVGLNPVTVLQQGNNFYLEAMQHGKYRYKGKVTGSDGEAVAAATVILLEPKDSTVLTYGITTDDGRFLIPCDKTDVIAKVNRLGYMPTFHRCTSFNVGTITMEPLPVNLKNVTVQARNATIYTDKTVYIPTQRQKNAAQNAIDLLRHMAIPQIRVNAINGTVTDNFGESVVIYINNLEASREEIEGLRTSEVRNVEYLEFPSDPRFRGQHKVIKIIVQEYNYGGYTKFTANESALVGLSSHINAFSKFTYKRMTYDLYVGATNNNSHHNGNSTKGIYSLINNQKEHVTVERNEIMENSEFKENHYPITLRATYNSEKVQIRNTVGFQHLSNPCVLNGGSLEYHSEESKSYTFERNNPQRKNSFSYSGSYFIALPRSLSLDISPTFDYSYTNDKSEYSASNSTSILRHAKENAYNFRIDGYLRKNIGQRHSLMIGVNGGQWSNNLHYKGTNVYHDKFSNGFAAGLIGYNLQTQKIAINYDAGFAWENSDINGFKIDDWYPFTHINVRYSLNDKNMFSVYFQYASNTAGISEKASDILKENEILYITGNPNLKNSRHTTVNIAYTWLPSNPFGISIYGRFFGLYNRMFQIYNHYDGGQALIREWTNDGDYLSGTIGMAFNWKLLNGNLQFYANPEIYFHKITGTCPLTYNPVTFNIQAAYYLNDFYFQGIYSTPDKRLRFNRNVIYHTKNYYSITAGWSKNDWNIKVAINNFFNKGWETSTWKLNTPLYSEIKTNYGNTYHPSISLSATYTFGYGKKVQRGNEVGAQSGAASAILK